MLVETWPLSRIRPYPKNARNIPQAAIDKVAASLREFGWRQPMCVEPDGTLIVGHVRFSAALQNGWTEGPVNVATDLTPAQIKAYRLTDNRSHDEATWNFELLGPELIELKTLDFDLKLTGFDLGEIRKATVSKGLTDPDEVPPVPAEPVTRLGDLWVMGEHRLLCGDATQDVDISRVMAGSKAELVFTSPPYLHQRDYERGVGNWLDLMKGIFGALPATHACQVLVNLGLVHRDGEWLPYWETWVEWMRSIAWRRFGWYVWDQGPGLPGDWNGRLAPSNEFIFHFNRVAERARKHTPKKAESIQYNDHGNGMRQKNGSMSGVSSPEKSLQTHKVGDSVFRVMRHKARGIECEHPAVFPVQLAREIIESFSDPNETIYEPMAGSCSTVLAAEQTARHCFGLEIEPKYCDIGATRWQNFTGREATLEGDGRTFAAIAQDRHRQPLPVYK